MGIQSFAGYEIIVERSSCTDGSPMWQGEIQRKGYKVLGLYSLESEAAIITSAQAEISRANELYRLYLTDELALAVQWWGDQLRTIPSRDPGYVIPATMAASMTQEDIQRPTLDSETIYAFQSQLEEESHRCLALSLARHERVWGKILDSDVSFGLRTDYEPEELLAVVTETLNIEGSRFPIKSGVSCALGRVVATRGYSGQPILLMGTF